MKSLISFVAVVLVLAWCGCKNKGALDNNGYPETLLVAGGGGENPDQMKLVSEPLRKYLEKKIGIPVEMVFTTDYASVIEALKSKKIHMADMGPFSYVIASRTIPLTPIVVMGVNGKPSIYHSTIVVNGHSGLKSIADIKARAKSLSFCFVDPASTSGHLIPRAFLLSIGLNPDTAFKQTLFAGSHVASALTVKSGKVDVGCVEDRTVGLLEKRGVIKQGDIRTVWVSAPIVGDPIVVRSDLNKNLIKKLQDAYLNMKRDAPQLIHNRLMYYGRDTARRAYMVCQDSFYDGLRKIANSIKGLRANN
jgi:phosphonate transport system substrate-binding protein